MYEDIIKKIIPTLNFKFPYSVDEYSKNLYLENYHCHKDFSNTMIADSPEPIEAYAKRIKQLGTKCLYSGEHGTQGNQFQVYKTAEKYGLKYIHSAEAYWVIDRKESDRTNCHIILAAKNAEGRKDINFALSVANEDGYYYRPRIDLELLFQIPKENIIVTSACIAGWNYENAEELWLKVHKHFRRNFFLEVQPHNTDSQKELNKKILRIAKENDIQIICGLDSHYIDEDKGKEKRDQILKYKHIKYPEEEGWYMDYPDTPTVIKRFQEQGILSDEEILRAIMNTNIFVSECEKIVLDKKFKIPSIYPDKSYEEKVQIYKQTLNEAYKKETLKSKEKKEAIRYEAAQVIDSGVVDYFLTSKKIVENAIQKHGGILTTTSRGSAASFVTNKLLGLTTIDRLDADIPIYAERFLTKERVLAGQMPDIDLNVAEQKPFVDAAKGILGEHGCYPLMAVEKLKKKAAWQLYAGANDVEPATANMISKSLEEYEKALKYAEDDEKDMINVEDYIPHEYVELFKKSNEYQGITVNLKVHACGYLLFDGDIRREIGLVSAISETTGKRTLCAAIEGSFLDEFGYVKEDFLIVDSVYLTYKFFRSIGQNVPSFQQLRQMIKDDEKTWEIYSKGITCCINQCERVSTTNKCKRYSPKTLAELSGFIAGIRPGFVSLINTYINRTPYTTGESVIDDLLSDTSNFMIYQESIMKILSFLGLDMGETYGVIKNISKKKYKEHPEMLSELKARLINGWKGKIGNTNNFEKVWNVIESSGSYAFNAPHAYSMAADSLYQAWFKAHYTKQFYEVAIDHYQQKNKKDKINELIREAIAFYGYKLGNYEFGQDNRRVNIDPNTLTIYPNLSSVKGFGDANVNSLYRWGNKKYDSFVEILEVISKETKINKTLVENLIKIDYFKNYGSAYKLLKIKEYFEIFNNRTEISKDKISEYDLPVEIFQKYGKETLKKYTKLNFQNILSELIKQIPDRETPLRQKINDQYNILNLISVTYPIKNHFYVLKAEGKNKYTVLELYEISNGQVRQVKIWNSCFDRMPINEKDIIHIYNIQKKNKREPTGEIDPTTGKRIYAPVPDKFEFWLDKYETVDNI